MTDKITVKSLDADIAKAKAAVDRARKGGNAVKLANAINASREANQARIAFKNAED